MKNRKPVVLITGGAQRIGKHIALHLAGQGFRIALHYNASADAAEKIAREICRKKGICKIFPADLSYPRQTRDLIPTVLKEFAGIDLLINNASIFERSNLKNGAVEMLDRHWAINLRAPYILSSEFFRRCKQGQIINILDTHVVKNNVSHVAYLLSKKALYELTKLAAVELAPDIRVNGIAPGLILPPAGQRNDYLDRLAQEVPLRRKGSPEKITQTIDFLLSNDYLTGQIIFVDGGEHLI